MMYGIESATTTDKNRNRLIAMEMKFRGGKKKRQKHVVIGENLLN